MRIAVISLIYKRTTLDSKGGAEVWVSNFIRESIKRHHEVDLYAIKGSLSGRKVRLIPSLDKPVSEYYGDEHFREGDPALLARSTKEFNLMSYMRILNEVHKRQDQYDVIINSSASPVLAFNADMLAKHVITIGHDPPHFAFNFHAKMFGWPLNNTLVFPSRYQNNSCARSIPQSRRIVIPHGIDLSSLRFNEKGGDTMVWMSRIDYPRMDKGIEEAIRIANSLGRKLIVTGFVERSSREYVDGTIKPLLTSTVAFKEQSPDVVIHKNSILGEAKLFLFPVKWEEPFGIVMLEAMACGTPVVAYARGSIPEVIEDGVTGFVVNSSPDDVRGDFIIKKTGQEGLCEAVERIYAMKEAEYSRMRANCRARVEKLYTVEKMVDAYESLYKTLTKKQA